MHARAEAKINRIMGAAYQTAFKVLETEVRNFMRADPRFVEYFHMVGWGPSFAMANGTHIQWSHEMPTKRGQDMLKWCVWFYDTHGAGNERVKAT